MWVWLDLGAALQNEILKYAAQEETHALRHRRTDEFVRIVYP